jgi:hypothetical protein
MIFKKKLMIASGESKNVKGQCGGGTKANDDEASL